MREYSRLRCLWIARDLPHPPDTGSKVYSLRLAESLAAAGASIRFLGLGATAPPGMTVAPGQAIEWQGIEGERRPRWATFAGSLPVAAAVDATAAYRRQLLQELAAPWDAVVFDNYGSGWALSACRRGAKTSEGGSPVRVHVSHNNELRLWADMSRHARWPWFRQRFLEFNARRIAALEQSLLESADLVTAITEEDRIAFVHRAPGRSFVTLSPGYSGPLAAPRRITRDTPRRVLLMGSFDWVVKRENLKQFLAVADPVFAREAITLDVLGDVPADLRDEFTACRAVRFHGFVKDPADLLDNARIGVVPELIGGGFKLKLLDYFFGRLPVATIAGAAAGLSMPLREHILQGSDMQTLVAAIVASIDDLDRLNAMQERGATLAQSEFQWRDRGRVFHAALERLVRSGSTVPLARIPEALDSLDMAGD